MENTTPDQNRKKILILSAILFFIVILLVITTALLSNSSPKKELVQPGADDITPGAGQNTIAEGTSPFPKVEVISWKEGKIPLTPPVSVNIYQFKQVLSLASAKALARSFLGTDQVKQKDGEVIAYTLGQGSNEISTFTSTLATGEFSYASTTGIPLPTVENQTGTQDRVSTFLKTLINDPTLKISATYKKRSKDGVTYYEIHRDWVAVGLPILNAVGLLNHPENLPLSNLTVGASLVNQPQNQDIYATSDRSDGFTRRNDFNTITIGVHDEKSSVVSFASNLRQLQTTNLQSTSLISYKDAVSKLKGHQYDFFYTSPSGEGVPMFDQVYPSNNARTEEAAISEAILTYVEQPPQVPQANLAPYWLFKGTALLDSGYRVNFIAGVAAAGAGPQGFSLFKPVYAQTATRIPNDPGQKQGTFEVTPLPTRQPTLTKTPNATQPPLLTQKPQPQSGCIPATSDLTNVRSIGSDLNAGQLKRDAVEGVRRSMGGGNAAAGDWYTYSPSRRKLNADDILTAIQSVEASRKRQPTRVEMDQYLDSLDGQVGCPVRITGQSPTIFIYGTEGQAFEIIPTNQVSYTDPIIPGASWEVIIGDKNNLTVNGAARKYLYYEYQNISFDRPEKGWNIKKANLSQLAKNIANELELTKEEVNRLKFELKLAASGVNAKNIFVGLIDEDEVNEKLALSVSPATPTVRLHFFVGNADGSVEAPLLSPVTRSSSLIIELGAVSAN